MKLFDYSRSKTTTLALAGLFLFSTSLTAGDLYNKAAKAYERERLLQQSEQAIFEFTREEYGPLPEEAKRLISDVIRGRGLPPALLGDGPD